MPRWSFSILYISRWCVRHAQLETHLIMLIMSLFSSILSHDGPARRATPQVTTDQKADLYFAPPDPTVYLEQLLMIYLASESPSRSVSYLLPQRALTAEEILMKKNNNRQHILAILSTSRISSRPHPSSNLINSCGKATTTSNPIIPQDCLLQLHGLTA